MKSWNINLKFSDGTSKNLELYDANGYFNGYLKLKRSYFSRLVKAIKMTKKYATTHAIEKVLGPNKDDWTNNPWMLVIAEDNEKKTKFWFFIKREMDLSGLLVAIGPKVFADYLNTNTLESKHDLKRLINYLITYLNRFNCFVLLPNNLA